MLTHITHSHKHNTQESMLQIDAINKARNKHKQSKFTRIKTFFKRGETKKKIGGTAKSNSLGQTGNDDTNFKRVLP